MKLFDAHCHMQLPEMFARANAAGVSGRVVCGTSSKDWNEIFQISEQFPQSNTMIGIHPWFIFEHWKKDFQTLEALLRENSSVGVGETGLDFSSFANKLPPSPEAKADKTVDKQDKFTNRAEQEASFVAHLDLARELNRPVAVHCVQAWGRLIEILREHSAPKIVLHAFGGAPELIPELVELNCWFSFCGSVTNPKAKRVRASVVAVPADRLLIETDSPDFPPVGCEAPNEPANLIYIAGAVAELRGVPVEEIAALTYKNAQKLFFSTAG